MSNRYASFYTALRRHPQLSKEDAVRSFTQGRTGSLRELDHWELQELTRRLQAVDMPAPATPPPGGEKANRMRKAIIAIFYNMKRTPADAIAWAEKQGVKGQKKKFNHYTTGELYVLISIAEKIRQDWQRGIRNRVKTMGTEK